VGTGWFLIWSKRCADSLPPVHRPSVQGACTGRRVLPSANVPRPAASSFISLREVPDALRTVSAAVAFEGSSAVADCELACASVLLNFRKSRARDWQNFERQALATADIGMTALNVTKLVLS
jgi:hypothetical protein